MGNILWIVAHSFKRVLPNFRNALGNVGKGAVALSLIIVFFIAIQKACKLIFKEMVALHWRKHLVKIQTENYFNKESYYYGKNKINTQDQRISQDTDRLTMALSELYAGSIVIPGVIIYYTIRLIYMFNWIVPLSCFIFFIFADLTQNSTINIISL